MKKILLLIAITISFIGKMTGQNYTYSYGTVAEISGTGTSVALTNSSSSGALPIGFDFHFWENTYSEFYINPSGAIQFGSGSATGLNASNPTTANNIPKAALPNNFIAFAWAGASDVSTANINYFVSGAAPNRILIVNFKNVKQTGFSWPAPEFVNTQIQLYEGVEGKIEIHNINNGASCKNTMYSGYICMDKMVGVENSSGTTGRAVTNTSRWGLDNTMVRLIYCPTNVPTPTDVTPNLNSCGAPGTINLSANCSIGTPVWYNSNQTPLSSTTINPTSYSNYLVRCEKGTCASEFATTIINITSTPEAPTLSKSPTTASNSGAKVTLTASGCPYGTLNWSDGFSQVNNYGGSLDRIVYPTATTIYKATCTISGCLGPEAEITAEVISPPTITASTPIEFCSGGTITLSATGCADAEVNWPDGTHGLTWTSPVLASNATSDKIYQYTATCTKNGVTTSSSNIITARALLIPPTPSVATANLNNVAPGTSVTLTATCTNVFYWYWNDGTDHKSPRSTYLTDNLYVNPTITTDYYVGTENGVCYSPRLKVTVVVIPTPPTITATTASTFEAGGSVSLTASGCDSPKIVQWYEATAGNLGVTGLTYSSPALEANNATLTSKIYTYYAKCSDGTNTSANSNNVAVTVTFKFGTISINNTTPTQICGSAGTSFVVNFTKTGSFANANTRVSLYERKEFVGTNIYTNELLASLTSTNSSILTLNSNIEASHGGGNPNLNYYIFVSNGTISVSYPITITRPAIPTINVLGSLPITTIGQTITLNTVTDAGISKQWYKKLPGSSVEALPGETNNGLTFIPEETAYYSVKSTSQDGCASISLSTKIPIMFTISGTGSPIDDNYTEGKLEFASFDCGGFALFPADQDQNIANKFYDTGTHFYAILKSAGYCFGTFNAYFVYRENNYWGIYSLAKFTEGSYPNYTYHFDWKRLFHTKNTFITIPGARLAAGAITNTVPPTTAVWINDATGAELILNLGGATEQPLPLTLISFTGKATENGNQLIWKTANEKAFSHFEIQKSVDAKKFEKIGEVIGNNGENYEFIDNSSLISHQSLLNFYRLKMVDIDGSFTYSKIVNIENSFEETVVGNIYPNPALNNEVFIDIQAIEAGNWSMKSYDITGKLLNTETKYLQKGINKVKVDLGNGGFGNRYIQIQSKGVLEVRKVLLK